MNESGREPEDEHAGVPAPPPTGDAAVDETLRALAEAVSRAAPDDGAADSRLAAFDATHRALQERLADVQG